MQVALERAKTAREAIEVITSLMEKHGYASEGESFSIVDPNEVWILEMIGSGNGSGEVNLGGHEIQNYGVYECTG